jgi:hypothetical protein
MVARGVSLGAMFGWVMDSFRFITRRPGTTFGAAGLTILFGLLVASPVYVSMFLMVRDGGSLGTLATGAAGMGEIMAKMGVAYLLTLLLALVLHPPVTAGWLRLVRAIDAGQPASAFDIFQPFREPGTWLRTVLYALLCFVVVVAWFALLAVLFSGVIVAMVKTAGAGLAGQMPGLPSGFWTAWLVFMLSLFVLEFAVFVGFGEVSLRETGPVAALGGAFSAVLRNLHKLIVFALAMGFVCLVFALILGLVFAVVLGAAALASPGAGNLVMFLLEIPLLLVLYPVLYAGMLYAWRSLLGSDAPAPSAGTDAVMTA